MARLDPETGLYRCPGCGERKPRESFYASVRRGVSIYCKPCDVARCYGIRRRRPVPPERAREYRRRHREKHAEAIAAERASMLHRLVRDRSTQRRRLAATSDPARMAACIARIDQLTDLIEQERAKIPRNPPRP